MRSFPTLFVALLAAGAGPVPAQTQTGPAVAEDAPQTPTLHSLRTKRLWMELAVARGEVRLIAAPEPLGDKVPAVEKVLVERADGTQLAPKSQEPYVEYAQSARRKKIAIRGVRAVFAAAALQPGARFRFQMSDGEDQVLSAEPGWFSQLSVTKPAEAPK